MALDVCRIGDAGHVIGGSLRRQMPTGVVSRARRPQGRVRGVIESMTGARFVGVSSPRRSHQRGTHHRLRPDRNRAASLAMQGRALVATAGTAP
jgi:hypothetical protein